MKLVAQLSVAEAEMSEGVTVNSPLESSDPCVLVADAVGPVTSWMVNEAAEEITLVLPDASCTLKYRSIPARSSQLTATVLEKTPSVVRDAR